MTTVAEQKSDSEIESLKLVIAQKEQDLPRVYDGLFGNGLPRFANIADEFGNIHFGVLTGEVAGMIYSRVKQEIIDLKAKLEELSARSKPDNSASK